MFSNQDCKWTLSVALRFIAFLASALSITCFAQTGANLQALRSSIPLVRMEAFYALVKPGLPTDESSRLALIDLLLRETVYIRSLPQEDDEIATYYGNLVGVVALLRDVRALDGLIDLIHTGRMVTDAVASFGTPALDAVTQRVRSADSHVAMGAVIVLKTMLSPLNVVKVSDPSSLNKIRSALEFAATSQNRYTRAIATEAQSTLQSVLKLSVGLKYVPVFPCRILETRLLYAGTTWTSQFGPPRLSAGVTRTIPVSSSPRCTIPSSAKAYVFNMTLDTIQENTGPVDFVTIWPTGDPRPDFWTARTTTGGYIANTSIVRAGSSGSVNVYSSHDVNMLLDINGYFTDDALTEGLLYYPIGPCRAIDTRGAVYSSLPPPYGNSRIQKGESRTFRLPSSPVSSPNCEIPPAKAYSMQMTLAPGDLTNGTPVAYITAWPAGETQPIISNMNSLFGYASANSAIVPSRADGSINLFAADSTNLIVDVNGYFAPDDGSGRGLLYFPITQCRVLNTLDSSFTGAFGGPQMTPVTDRILPIPSSTRCPGLPSSAKAWVLNATVVPNGNPMPFLSMWPAGIPWPGISQLNAFQGQTISNSAIVPASLEGSISVKVSSATHVVVEIAGYFGR